MVSGIGDFLGGGSEVKTTTGFGSLPSFAQGGLRKAIGLGGQFADDPSIFEAAPITSPQREALDVLTLGAQPLTEERFGEQLDVFQNPFIQQTLDPALADLQRVGAGTFGDIGQQATQAGAFGGTRQAVQESELARNLAKEAGRLSANVRSQGFESAANKALAQLGQQQQGASTLFNVGEALRQLQQQTQQAPATAAQFLSGLIGQIPTGGGTQQTSGGGSFADTASGIGSIISAGSSLAGLLSDERTKENIEFVGVEDGYNIYEFSYNGHPERYRGVMAQEVLENDPDAVTNDNGILTVDYTKIGPDMEVVNG